MRRFENRSALITAAASGLGLGVAQRLASEGARVVIWDRDASLLADVLKEAAGAGLDIAGRALDMMDKRAIGQAVAEMIDSHGRIDILVNNIGGSLHVPFRFLEQSDEDWQRVMDVNVKTCVWATRAVLPHMQKAHYGRIINMGSKAGRFGSLFAGTPYVAAKGAMQAFTLQIAQEFGPDGITCNTVCPGAILTPRVESFLNERHTPEERARVLASIPVRRQGRVEDVAAAIAYLTSEEAGFVNGATLDVNGGQAMSI
ncbi:MAG TPA: SDR family NAD(P)-dependent oxidoreductase [Hyphomicrobiaceae bacterium]|jgi:NAD(P)-dependent dehydrogenase (short-subunit alcohol dehydrogenase family)|nr:SDR family NAD(P)-dependent oxidoreductase [Hyphomicrobiaceae bacterium]